MMALNEQAMKDIQKSIDTICQTAIVVRDTMEEDGQDLIDKFDNVVECITVVYAMDENTLSKYRNAVKGVTEAQTANDKLITPSDAVRAQQVIFGLCDTLTDPKQIMEYVRTANELVDVWNI